MQEVLLYSVEGCRLLIFVVALFFAAISGQKMELSQRVALLYAYCLIVSYSGFIDFYSIVFGSLLVLFLVFEVFGSDVALIRFFSFKYKLLDFLFRLLFEYCGIFFYLILFISSTEAIKSSVLTQVAFLLLVILLGAMTSRQRFSTKSISTIVEELESLGGNPACCSFKESDNRKLEILLYMEDGNFLNRGEDTHIVTVRHLVSRACARVREQGIRQVGGDLCNLNSLLQLVRGYGTIEMQIIRNVGLNFGSYRLTVRRKVFELLFSQAVFNSYIDQLGKGSAGRENIKKWTLRCYLNLASVKIGNVVCFPKEDVSTFQQLFGKEFFELSDEEFFVWCLGLPHYENGVGRRAIAIHSDAVRRFRLRRELIDEVIARLRPELNYDR